MILKAGDQVVLVYNDNTSLTFNVEIDLLENRTITLLFLGSATQMNLQRNWTLFLYEMKQWKACVVYLKLV